MKNYYSISIPKPCHEDWNTMTPKEKGRFCNSCNKTVIDFTMMKTYEIQDFITENKSNRICGHFKQTQLDSINLHIPSHVLSKQYSFHKLFLLALMIVMGTTLFSCTNRNGNKQKIYSIEVIDTINKNAINILEGLPLITETDSVSRKASKTKPEDTTIEEPLLEGEIVIETTVGDIEIIEDQTLKIDSIKVIETPVIDGEIEILEPPYCLTPTESEFFGLINVETPPEFPNTPNQLNREEKQEYFSNRITDFISEKFNISTAVNFGLLGKQRIYVQFTIDENGNTKAIKARAPHYLLEKEAKRIIKLLPQFKPAKEGNKSTSIVYNLPIIFQIEE